MGKVNIKVFVEGQFSHFDFRKDVFSMRSTIIYCGKIHNVETEKEGDLLYVYLTEKSRKTIKEQGDE